MQFLKVGDRYQVSRITGSQDNVLGIELGRDGAGMRVVEWALGNGEPTRSTAEEVGRQVLQAVEEFNRDHGTSYTISVAYFAKEDSSRGQVYVMLTKRLLGRIHRGEPFEVRPRLT